MEEESIRVQNNKDIGSHCVKWRVSFEFTGCASGGWLVLVMLVDSSFEISSSQVPANARAIRETQKSIDANNSSLTNQILSTCTVPLEMHSIAYITEGGQQHWIGMTVIKTDSECFKHQAGMSLGWDRLALQQKLDR